MSAQVVTLFSGLDAVATEDPGRPCLSFESESLSFSDVMFTSISLAGGLRARGAGDGLRIGVLSPNHPMGVLSAIAILRAGATWLPINPRDSISQISSLLTRLRCDILLFHSDFVQAVADFRSTTTVAEYVSIDEEVPGSPYLPDWAAASTDDYDRPMPTPESIAAIFATGGTTGLPRGVCFSYQTLGTITQSLAQHIGQNRPSFLAAMPLTHAAGRICLGVIEAGGTTVVLPAFEPGAVLRAIPRHQITFTTLAPTMLAALLDHPEVLEHDYSSLRFLGVGAAPLPVELLKRAIAVFGAVVIQGYGQTEAPLYIATKRPGDDFADEGLQSDERLRSCGRASDFSELRILGADGAILPPGEIGEIVVRGEFVMDGYDNDPEATAATVAPDGFHRTGDLGFLDEDGFLTITGRAKDMIISGGFNVYPAEVEDVLASYPAVGEVAVVGLPDDKWGELVVAAVQPRTGEKIDTSALLEYARGRLGGVKTPKEVWVVADLPRNANGKILKRLLVNQLAEARCARD